MVYKEAKPDIDKLDPYIMMMEKISLHLKEESTSDRLDLARQCLYLKVNESLTDAHCGQSHAWRQNIMQNLVNKWRWTQSKLALLDGRKHWKIDQVCIEHKKIIDSLTVSYRKESDYFRYHSKHVHISQRDLRILGRKLYAAFEKKAGKIEVMIHDSEINLHESHISLHPIGPANNELGWAFYVGAINQIDKKTPAPSKKSTRLLKLLCWGFFNQVISSQTNFVLDKDLLVLNTREIKQILETLEQIFPDAAPGHASMEALVKPAQLEANILFLNIGVDPFLNHHPSGTQITTKQTNALNYSSLHENLLITIDQVLLNSWREVMTYHFDGENGLIECLKQYLNWNHETDLARQSPVPRRPSLVCCFSSVRGEAISRCISDLFNNVLNAFHGAERAYTTRYLFAVEESFYILWQDQTGPKHQKIPDQKELLRELSYPLAKFQSLTIDPTFSEFKVLQLIFSQNKENHIQLFYQNHRKTADIYIIDERGSLYHQSTPLEANNIHINHFVLFLDSVVNRLSYSNNYFNGTLDDASIDINSAFDDVLSDLDNEVADVDLQLEVFEIQKESPNQLILEEQFSKLQSMPVQFFKIQVIADLNKDGSRRYVIYANGKEFNSFEYGRDVYKKVAYDVIQARHGQQRYPIYITDIDLSSELKDAESSHGIQATQLLKFKQEIERRLNQAIKNI
jgi:adenylate cyclase class 1